MTLKSNRNISNITESWTSTESFNSDENDELLNNNAIPTPTPQFNITSYKSPKNNYNYGAMNSGFVSLSVS